MLVSKWVCKKLMPPSQEKSIKNQGVRKYQANMENLEKLNNQNPEKGPIGPHTSP